MVLGKGMKFLLIALDICLTAYIISQVLYRILPVYEPVFWVGVLLEIGLTLFAYRSWMLARRSASWNNGKTVTVVLIVIAIAWPLLVRTTQIALLRIAAQADLLFFWAALTLLIYSSFVIKELPKPAKPRP